MHYPNLDSLYYFCYLRHFLIRILWAIMKNGEAILPKYCVQNPFMDIPFIAISFMDILFMNILFEICRKWKVNHSVFQQETSTVISEWHSHRNICEDLKTTVLLNGESYVLFSIPGHLVFKLTRSHSLNGEYTLIASNELGTVQNTTMAEVIKQPGTQTFISCLVIHCPSGISLL